MSRYARQITLPEIGEEGQHKMARTTALVAGAGGLAATVLPLLAGAGLRRIVIADGDTVSLNNLHRQHLFTEADCGQNKAERAAARCAAINSDVDVIALPQALTPNNAKHLAASADLVLDCADSYAVSYALSDICLAQNLPLFSASALAFGGYAGGFSGTAPSLRALFPDAPVNAANCASAGVMGPVVSMLGALQVQMALHHIIGLVPSPLGQIVQIDARNFRFSSFRFDGATEPEQHFSFVAPDDMAESDLIIELRSKEEAPTPLHPAAERHLPSELRARLTPDNRRLVLCCGTGLRAWRAAEDIQDIWPGEIALAAASAS